MKVSKAAASTARRIFRMCQTDGRFDEAKLGTAVRMLVARKPRDHRGVLHALKRLTRLELDRRHVVVQSPETLDEETRQRVAAGLAAKYGGDLTYEYQVVPGLIAGLKVRVGCDVWDGTVKGRLDRLAQAF